MCSAIVKGKYTNKIRQTVLRMERVLAKGLGVILQKNSQCTAGAKYKTRHIGPLGIRTAMNVCIVSRQPITITAAHKSSKETIGWRPRLGRTEAPPRGAAYGFAFDS